VDPAPLLVGLTAAQRAAVTSEGNPLCILAGAGAGKTRTLSRRIAYRVAIGEADPAHVLALTFTRKAAGELSARLVALGTRDRITTGTFHSVAYAQLRRWWADRRQPPPRLLTSKAGLLGALLPGRHALADVAPAQLAAEIEWAQARLVTPAGYAEAAAAAGRRPEAAAKAVAALYDRYVSEKARRGLIDFDDLLSGCIAAIISDPGFAAAQRWRWRHLFVDEFQDVNPLQHRLLLGWLGTAPDLCVVGDPNQAIYGWNGADRDLLQGLSERWPGAEVVRLDANHRSTPQVVAAAGAVLGLAPGSLSSSRPGGPPVTVRSYDSDVHEARGVVADIRRAHAAGSAWRHLAILMRTNAQAAAFEAACRAAKVPCRIAGAPNLLDDPAVGAALGDVTSRPTTPAAAVVAQLEDLAGAAGPSQDRPSGSADPPGTARLATLVALAADFASARPGGTASGFEAWLATTVADEGADQVTVSTFHRAKGLEWRAVWVTGLEEGLVPIAHAVDATAQAEERRLLYVAMTRAEHELRCSWARQRHFGAGLVPREPSPWLAAAVPDAASVANAAGGDVAGTPGRRRPPTELWRRRLGDERARPGTSRTGWARRQAASPSGAPDGPGADPAVVGALTAWRSAAARAAAVPSHVILHDVTLAALSAARPSTLEELLTVPGLGPVKVSRYGTTLLELVARHRAAG
jgi:DNA helicase-2/ATP-dependent DNA helicase PcrA